MKSTGIVRKIDDLGRVVVPKELRKVLNIIEGTDTLEIFTDGNSIIFKKYQPGCIFCGSVDDLAAYKDKHICLTCAENLLVKLKQR